MSSGLATHLTELYRGWFDAIGGVGVGPLDSVLADEWVYTNYDGVVRDKRGYLSWIEAVTDTAEFVGPYDVSVQRHSNIALAFGGYRVSDRASGAVLELRFTGVWVFRDDRWQSLLHHNSVVTDQA